MPTRVLLLLAALAALAGGAPTLPLPTHQHSLHHRYTHELRAAVPTPVSGPVCVATAYGAVGDNTTLATAQIQAAMDDCASRYPGGSTVVVPAGAYKVGSLELRSHQRLHLEAGAGLYGSADPRDHAMALQWFGGNHAWDFNALLHGANLTDVSVTGANTNDPSSPGTASIVDGVGWTWWCQAKVDGAGMPIRQPWCDAFNPTNASLPRGLLPEPRGSGRPRLVNIYNSTRVTLAGFTAMNSPQWTIHIQNSRNVLIQNMTVLSPRAIGNTDGVDPESCDGVLVTDCHIDVGDDGVSIKSYNITTDAGVNTMVPCRNVTMRRLRILSRNWCIGSGMFGGIFNVLFEDSVIGVPGAVGGAGKAGAPQALGPASATHLGSLPVRADAASHASAVAAVPVPWAFKFKSHQYFPGPIENVTVRRITVGPVSATPWMYPKGHFSAFDLGLTYGGRPPAVVSGIPRARNITFENIHVQSADAPGFVTGLKGSCFEQLTLRNITFGNAARLSDWACTGVDVASLTAAGLSPPFPASCPSTCR